MLTCSPDQSLFTNVTSVQKAYDNNMTAVEAIDVFVADAYGQAFYNSCKVCLPPGLYASLLHATAGLL